jgi:hypothetical protein
VDTDADVGIKQQRYNSSRSSLSSKGGSQDENIEQGGINLEKRNRGIEIGTGNRNKESSRKNNHFWLSGCLLHHIVRNKRTPPPSQTITISDSRPGERKVEQANQNKAKP